MKIPWIQVEPDDETKVMLEAINVKLNKLIFKQQIEINMEELQMGTAAEMLAAVEAQTTVVAGINTLIQSLKDDLANIPGIPADVQAAIDAAIGKVTANTDALAVNLVANTPVEPPPAPPE